MLVILINQNIMYTLYICLLLLLNYTCELMIDIYINLYKFQYAVLYSGEECLGGSMISYPGPSYFALNPQNSISDTRFHNLIGLMSNVQM